MPESSDVPNLKQEVPDSVEKKVRSFIEKTLAHPHLKNAFEEVKKALDPGNPYSLISVVGPSGVGKTTLCRRIVRHFEEAPPSADTGRIPVSMIEAIASSSGAYDWKEHFCQVLESLGEPLVDKKMDCERLFGIFEPQYRTKSYGRLSRRPSIMDLRKAVESSLTYRKPAVFVIDEAQHLKKMASGKRLIDQMDTIKSIANRTGVKHLLSGTYELLGLSDLSAQLSRRTMEIHLPRYRFDLAEERNAFFEVLVNLEESLPVPEQSPLESNLEYIYERTAGCVGILKDWMVRALTLALFSGSLSVTIDHLVETSLSDRQIERIIREIQEGERIFRVDRTDRIRANLGILPIETVPDVPVDDTKEKKKTRRLPGKRKPVRDPVGNSLNGPSENVG